jgi:L-seryl-tRNA(Ser) seleniumtransferase
LNIIANVVECQRMNEEKFRQLPSVDKVISNGAVSNYFELFNQDIIVNVVRQHINEARARIENAQKPLSYNDIVKKVVSYLESLNTLGIKPVINATGIIIHTNLGRAPISKEAIAAMELASSEFNNLEFNLESGIRGSRHVHIENILCQLSGAESGLAVNNNAAGVMLTLAALAKRKEVIVSRGEAVEIGGGFRVPDVMRQSGAKLVEVGTTNCTYIHDYENAISDRTAALLRVHPSNFRLQGFTHRVEIDEIVSLAEKKGIPVIDDLGSGCFLDTTEFGLEPEPTVQDSISAGTGVVCFSGDKLVGGPQAGIILGKKKYIDLIKKHPLARAVRIDKTRLAGLAATLTHYLKGEAQYKVPVWMMICMPVDVINLRAEEWAAIYPDKFKVVDGESMVGGGSLPGDVLPTRLLKIRLTTSHGEKNKASFISRRLREYNPPVIVRIEKDNIFLDPRTVFPEQDEQVKKALKEIVDII